MIIWVRNYGGSGWRIPVVAGDYPAPAPPRPALPCFNGCCTVLGKRRKYTAGSNNSSCKKK